MPHKCSVAALQRRGQANRRWNSVNTSIVVEAVRFFYQRRRLTGEIRSRQMAKFPSQYRVIIGEHTTCDLEALLPVNDNGR